MAQCREAWEVARPALEQAAGHALRLKLDPFYFCANVETASDNWVAHFSVIWLPECNGVVVFNTAFVREAYRRRGLGLRLHNLRLDMARRCGAKLAIATVVVGNAPQERIMEHNNWKSRARYRADDGHEVNLFVKELL